MSIVFLDIDSQKDFLLPSGSLYVPGAVSLAGKLRQLTACADACRIPIISSLDCHRRNDPEFRRFPPHCIRRTAGYAKIPQALARATRQTRICKDKLDIFTNPRAARLLARYTTCFVYGVALEYCVKAACLGCRRLGLDTYLVSDATAAVTQKAGAETKKLLQLKGVKFIRTAAVKRRVYGSATAGCR